MKNLHLHLVSDSTGETVISIARACVVQFEGIEVIDHLWPMVRTKAQLKPVLKGISADPGMVVFTLLDKSLRDRLELYCADNKLTCIAALDTFMAAFRHHLGVSSQARPGRQHALDAEYFIRIEALNYVMRHDDGQSALSLAEADVILVGVSRTSKTPTCIYLANRGIKAANVPIVPGAPLPPELLDNEHSLIVGLTEDANRLVQIRRNRMRSLDQQDETDYTDLDQVKGEIAAARRLFNERQWPTIDVTRRSIEETAAAIIQLHSQRQREGKPLSAGGDA
ncbi:MAG: pyruvate, water dikinase regulatory protein [Alphaproteobacteria bacterium]